MYHNYSGSFVANETKSVSGYSNSTEFIVSKHRNGPLGTAQLTFNPQYTSFENLPKELFDGFAVDFIDAINTENKK